MRHLVANGRELEREGSRHTMFINPANGRRAALSRQTEISNNLVRQICNQLTISWPGR